LRPDRPRAWRSARLVDPPGRAVADLLGCAARIDRLAGRGSSRQPAPTRRPTAGVLRAGGRSAGSPAARRTPHPRGVSVAARRGDGTLPPLARPHDRSVRHAGADPLCHRARPAGADSGNVPHQHCQGADLHRRLDARRRPPSGRGHRAVRSRRDDSGLLAQPRVCRDDPDAHPRHALPSSSRPRRFF